MTIAPSSRLLLAATLLPSNAPYLLVVKIMIAKLVTLLFAIFALPLLVFRPVAIPQKHPIPVSLVVPKTMSATNLSTRILALLLLVFV